MARRKTAPLSTIKRMIETAQSAGINPTRIEFTAEGAIILSQEIASAAGGSELDRWEQKYRERRP